MLSGTTGAAEAAGVAAAAGKVGAGAVVWGPAVEALLSVADGGVAAGVLGAGGAGEVHPASRAATESTAANRLREPLVRKWAATIVGAIVWHSGRQIARLTRLGLGLGG
jgi:hypothetical protein